MHKLYLNELICSMPSLELDRKHADAKVSLIWSFFMFLDMLNDYLLICEIIQALYLISLFQHIQ